jgi:hypothetical protein
MSQLWECPIKSRVEVRALVVICAFTLTFASGVPAWASLGGDAASIEADQVHLQGTRTTTPAESYTVHEIQAPTGTVVKEYVSSEGRVFAIAWHGPWVPDLRQLLGNYFEQYRAAAQTRSGTRMVRKPVMIDQPGLVVQIGGHIRAFAGRAYVPGMLPSGVRAEDIQ